jgi:hypothetical protein
MNVDSSKAEKRVLNEVKLDKGMAKKIRGKQEGEIESFYQKVGWTNWATVLIVTSLIGFLLIPLIWALCENYKVTQHVDLHAGTGLIIAFIALLFWSSFGTVAIVDQNRARLGKGKILRIRLKLPPGFTQLQADEDKPLKELNPVEREEQLYYLIRGDGENGAFEEIRIPPDAIASFMVEWGEELAREFPQVPKRTADGVPMFMPALDPTTGEPLVDPDTKQPIPGEAIIMTPEEVIGEIFTEYEAARKVKGLGKKPDPPVPIKIDGLAWHLYPINLNRPLRWVISNDGRAEKHSHQRGFLLTPSTIDKGIPLHEMKVPAAGFAFDHPNGDEVNFLYKCIILGKYPLYVLNMSEFYNTVQRPGISISENTIAAVVIEALVYLVTRKLSKMQGDIDELGMKKAEGDEKKDVEDADVIANIPHRFGEEGAGTSGDIWFPKRYQRSMFWIVTLVIAAAAFFIGLAIGKIM